MQYAATENVQSFAAIFIEIEMFSLFVILEPQTSMSLLGFVEKKQQEGKG